MKTIKYIVIVVLFSLSGQSFADKNAREEAEILLDSLGMDELLQQSIEKMLDLEFQRNPSIAPYKQVMLKFFNKHMSYKSLKDDMIGIYADAFTAQELEDLNTFYRTETGQKAIKMMPELMGKGADLGAQRVQDNIEELQAMIKAESERIQQLQTE